MSNNKIEIVVGECGTIQKPVLHDSYLISIETSESASCLLFHLLDGQKVKCTMLGVEKFIANEFRAGNIVLDMTLEQGEPLSNDARTILIPEPKVKTDKFKNYCSSINKKLINRELYSITLNPSYGCEVYALCKKIYFETIN